MSRIFMCIVWPANKYKNTKLYLSLIGERAKFSFEKTKDKSNESEDDFLK